MISIPTQNILLLGVCAFALIVIGTIVIIGNNYTLNRIKSRPVGDGQHGTAHFASLKDVGRTFKAVRYQPSLWRRGVDLPNVEGLIIGTKRIKPGGVTALIDDGDVHTLMVATTGAGKTSYFLYPNIEYCCAAGMSFITTDTKGDLYRNTAAVAKDYYGYDVSVIDLRNATQSDEYNIMHLVNKYTDLHKKSGKLSHKAKAEKFAKISAKTIIQAGSSSVDFGQNVFFFDAAEGIITSTIMLVAEFCQPEERHIVSVFKLIQELVGPSAVKGGKTRFQQLVDLLPTDHKARWFAGAALNTSDQAMASVLSTALSRLISFLDSELEQIVCFGTSIDMEKFSSHKCAIYLVLPEEDNTKHFLISLLIQQFYRELLTIADEHGGRLPRRIMFYLDEIGSIPKIEALDLVFSASRSRSISIVAIIQSLAQFQKTYGDEGAEIIIDNCQNIITGGFSPSSKTSDTISSSMGTQTVLSGTVSHGRGDPSEQLQMIEKPLMSSYELKTMPRGDFIVLKTGCNPMKTKLPLYTKWGLSFEREYNLQDRSARPVTYATRDGIETAIIET